MTISNTKKITIITFLAGIIWHTNLFSMFEIETIFCHLCEKQYEVAIFELHKKNCFEKNTHKAKSLLKQNKYLAHALCNAPPQKSSACLCGICGNVFDSEKTLKEKHWVGPKIQRQCPFTALLSQQMQQPNNLVIKIE